MTNKRQPPLSLRHEPEAKPKQNVIATGDVGGVGNVKRFMIHNTAEVQYFFGNSKQ